MRHIIAVTNDAKPNIIACKACWPDGGSKEELNAFYECVQKEIEKLFAKK
jgi:hypothetical protein